MSPLVTRPPDVPSLAAGRLRFRGASRIGVEDAEGDWRLEVTGPSVVRDRWDRVARLAGAGGLWGLRLNGRGGGATLEAGRRGTRTEDRALRVVADASRVDDLATLAVTFPTPDRFPWPWLRLELRQLHRQGTWPVEDGWLLGLLMFDLPGRIPLPVLLQRDEPVA